ncbi:MAG: hypothetical protein KDA28_17675, partial [Phycisphaerales bacterium]|nr:hypothetical protein [Phycisphaerales bacterium]
MSVVVPPEISDGFDPRLRREQQRRFVVGKTSTGSGFVTVDFPHGRRRVYDNANLSVYSRQPCNARCPFCVEELRPLSRGTSLATDKRAQQDDVRYFAALERTLDVVAPIDPSVSITGGEPSLDPRLPDILAVLAARDVRKRTMTTNASGLLRSLGSRDVLDTVLDARLAHL